MVVTVVGCNGGASGGGFGEHGGGCPLVTAEPGLPVAAASAGELGEAAPDTCFAVWVQPATPVTRTAASAAGRVKRNFQANIGVTVLRPISFLKSLPQRVRSYRKKQMTASVRTSGLPCCPAARAPGRQHRQLGAAPVRCPIRLPDKPRVACLNKSLPPRY